MTIQPLRSDIAFLNPVAPTDWEKVVDDWLGIVRSQNSQRAYRKDIDHFLSHKQGLTIGGLLDDRHHAYEIISRYRGKLIKQGLAPATINRRLSALKSLAAYCYRCGHSEFSLEVVKLEKNRVYRDTSGIDTDSYKALLGTCDRSTLQGLRDFAILSLLWANALRRAEVCKCNVSDFDAQSKSLRIFGKGRGNQSEYVLLGEMTRVAIADYLKARSTKGSAEQGRSPDDPLFVAHKAGYQGRRLSTNSIYNIVCTRAELAGISKKMSPHRIRHSAITTALDVTGGDVRRVQKLSRHSNLNTLMIYDDNRRNAQGEITNLLDGLV